MKDAEYKPNLWKNNDLYSYFNRVDYNPYSLQSKIGKPKVKKEKIRRKIAKQSKRINRR